MNSLRDFEVHYNVAIPADIAQYFITFDGLENGESDTDMISFWPLGKIRKVIELFDMFGTSRDLTGIVKKLPQAESYFVFAEYLCFSHVYAFKLTKFSTEESPVIWIGSGQSFGKLTDSFSDFLRMYLISPGELNNAVLKLPVTTFSQ